MPAGVYTFYFEVIIVNAGRKKYSSSPSPFRRSFQILVNANLQGPNSVVSVGFCDGDARRRGMPGWSHGSWGYHSDGKKFSDGKTGEFYGDKYGSGDIVGCGVDLISNCAFFTKNGTRLGE